VHGGISTEGNRRYKIRNSGGFLEVPPVMAAPQEEVCKCRMVVLWGDEIIFFTYPSYLKQCLKSGNILILLCT
jgi:hypothetical protein